MKIVAILLLLALAHKNFGHKAVKEKETRGINLFDNCIFINDECPNNYIKFWFYSNETRDSPVLLNIEELPSDIFQPKLPIRILIHGYTGSRDDSPNVEVRPVLLQTQKVYVITVDYERIAERRCYYPWAVYNARIIAKCLGQLINILFKNDWYTPKDIHLIGFSLGAQIAGLTANYVTNKLDRITGLDPARPGFVTTEMADKLDPSDANYVDVIHTDPFMLALLGPAGHVDFYPNLRYFNQLGCYYGQNAIVRSCNHFRAPIYYAESITSEKGFWSYSCGSWLEFYMQRCMQYIHKPIAKMGYFVPNNLSGAYFLTTNSEAPFAKGPIFDFEFVTVDKNEVN